MKEITVEVSTPIEYSFKSEMRKGSFLTITEPTGIIAANIGILKGQIGMATKKSIEGLKDLNTASDTKDDEDSTPEDMGEAGFAMLTMGGADMSIVMTTLRKILMETAKIAGEGKFTSPIFDRMAYDDIEKVLKAYLGNFMIAS